MSKAICTNGQLREVPEMAHPDLLNYETVESFAFDLKRFGEQEKACKEYPIIGTHSFKEGEVYEEGRDYKIGEREVQIKADGHLSWTTQEVAIPLQEPTETEDELWDEVAMIIAAKQAVGYVSPETVKIIQSKFSITRKP